jgi:hypothetical protein
MAYPNVNIVNSTSYSVSGSVEYASAFCANDNYGMGPNQPWTASGRGVCLVTKITANVQAPGGTVSATPYTSSGTSYSQFAVIQTNDNPFAFDVTRRVSLAPEDAPPADYKEPTTQQKK